MSLRTRRGSLVTRNLRSKLFVRALEDRSVPAAFVVNANTDTNTADPMDPLNPVFTLGNQIMEPLITHKGMTKRQAESRAVELLDLVGIPDARRRLYQYPHQFSGGMRQRVMIAIALACDPDVLIADEPTTARDVTIQAQILELVKELRQKLGMAIIWITHDLGVIAGIPDRVMVMYGAEVV